MHADDAGTPGIVVTYRPYNCYNGADGAEWACYTWNRDNARMGREELGMSEIKASPLELKLLLKLLDINKKFLSPEYHPEKERFEERFQTSVIFPIAPLGFEALASLNSDPGCAVCGKKQVKRCSGCQSVSYCSGGASYSYSLLCRP